MPHDHFTLLFGPYKTPRVRRGSKLFCEINGTVTVGGFRFGEIAWPWSKQHGRPAILCGDLVKAVKRESSIAVAHHFGVSIATVMKWRRMLKVPRANEGSVRRWHDIAVQRTDDRLMRARNNSLSPTSREKRAATLRARPLPKAFIEASRRAAKLPRSKSWKKKMSAYWRNRGHPPGHPERAFWKPEEDALLGTDTDAKVARLLNRSSGGVALRRWKLGIPAFLVRMDDKKIRRFRKRLGLTQHELAAGATVYRNAVANVELGLRKRMRRDVAQRIANVLECEVEELERKH